jgi:hypothetical protein
MTKDARYFKHESTALYDPKIEAMMFKYGVEGYGRYWIVLEMMRNASHYRLEVDDLLWGSLANRFRCSPEQARHYVEDCTKLYRLFVLDQEHNFLFSSSFLLRMDKLEEIKEKRKQSGSMAWKD